MDEKLYDILVAPEPALKTQSKPIDGVTADIQTQMDRMLATMYDDNGIGLAANQVGILNRVLVMDVPEGIWEYSGEDKQGVLTIGSTYKSGENDQEPSPNPIVMANPEIIWESEQRSVYDEGCLSVPGQYALVERPAKVRVKFLDREGKEQEIELAGLDSHCLQHELDHLNGILFIDYLSRLKRNTLLRKVAKFKKGQNIL